MGIIRVAKDKNYVTMNRTALNDKRLSWKAKGIMAYMLSMPDDWVFYMEELQSHSTDGKASFQSGFKELKDCGYVERKPIREGRRIKEWETIVHEVPLNSLQTDFQEVENQEVGFQEVENQRLLSTDINQVLNKPNTDNTKAATPLFINITKCIKDQLVESLKMEQKLQLQSYIEQIEDPAVIYECINITEQETPDWPVQYLFKLLDKTIANRFTLDDVKRDHQHFKQRW